MKVPLAFLSTAVVLTSVAAEAPEVSDAALRDYQTLPKMTDRPRSIGMQFFALCGRPPAAIATEKRTGPHFSHWINVYMNDPARTHFEARDPVAFPAGSIVVKEKLISNNGREDEAKTITGTAGMIKHPAGYDSKTGDWEFFFFEKDGKMERGTTGKMAACADCHHEAANDFVFGDFAKPPEQSRTAQPN